MGKKSVVQQSEDCQTWVIFPFKLTFHKTYDNILCTLAGIIARGAFNTILILAILWRLKNQMALSGTYGYYDRLHCGLLILNTWCDLMNVESRIYIKGNFSVHFFFFIFYQFVESITVTFFGSHLIYVNQLYEKCNDICEWFLDLLESLWDGISKCCEIGIERVIKYQMQVPTIKNLSLGQKQLYQYILLSFLIAIRGLLQERKATAIYIAITSLAMCLTNLSILLWINFFNSQLWMKMLTLWETNHLTVLLHRQLWLRWLALWEKVKEKVCKEYLKMPGGLQPNQYHTRYYIGTNRLRIIEYGVFVEVLPDLSHVGRRCFLFCGFNGIWLMGFHLGDREPVPTAPSG